MKAWKLETQYFTRHYRAGLFRMAEIDVALSARQSKKFV